VSLTIVGMDEAGFGPMIGPLTVGMAAFRVHDWTPASPPPDLWALLAPAVTRSPGDARKIPIEDSKRLKLPNDAKRHPLTHLLRGVLAPLAATGLTPAIDADLFAALGCSIESHPWYAGDPIALPIDPDRLKIDANLLARAMADARVELLELSVFVVGETRFNQVVRDEGSKARATALGLSHHISTAWSRWADITAPGHETRVVLDRQGGRTDYANYLANLIPQSHAATLNVHVDHESPQRARYTLKGATPEGSSRALVTLVQPEAESSYLPVALASMAAKVVRELLMARMNRYWLARAALAGLSVKPTAGYVQDARRWLEDLKSVIPARDRKEMVRRA
jgi:ribonuclease HII